MDARLVWDTWRRILSDDGLVEIVTHAGHADGAALARLGAAERAVVDDYASTPRATKTNVGMYRRSLVRIARVALGCVPMSQHLLLMSGLDVDEVGAAFARVNGYADDGPNFWRLAGAVVAYLATRPEFNAPTHQDVLAIDQARVALALRLGQGTVDAWPTAVAAGIRDTAGSDRSAVRFVASRAAVVVRSRHDLTRWIENPHGFDPDEALNASPRHWLIYFPDADSTPAYAELSERSARIFELLATPHSAADVARVLGSLSEAEALKVVDRLTELGVVVGEKAGGCVERGAFQDESLSSDAFVMLDPAVEILDVEIDGHSFLCQGHFAVGMAVPPGEGLSDFVGELAGKPVRVGALRKGFDDQHLIDTMLAALRQHGFLHVTSQDAPSADALAQLRRSAAERRRARLCHTLDVRLDATSADAIRARAETESTAPQLHLRCAHIGDHAPTFAELARLRQAGQLRLHDTVVQTTDPRCDAEVVRSLRRLGAGVIVDDVRWPAPERPIAGVDVLTRAGIAVHARITPDRSFLDPETRARALAWAERAGFSGWCLVLDADALWPAGEASEADFLGVFQAVSAWEEILGDVSIVSLPSDEVLLGNASSPGPEGLSDIAARFRLAYLRWRLPLLKSFEGDNTFSQTPEAEEKLVRLREDLLPNHPELLHLVPGSVVVDVCGGNGRVARRLSPLVGADGLVVSIEMLRCVTDRARRFACEQGYLNVQFRAGLAQRIPFPAGAADAAVNEWTGAIWQLGLGPAMVAEMARVVRVGGRIAVTHRLVRLPLDRLGQPWVQFDNIYALMREAFDRPDLAVVTERVWGQTVSTLAGEKASAWRKHYVPRIVNPFDVTYTEDKDPGPHADVCLTLIAERVQ
ncbi:methyltransferase domain-containing protein [Burkholderia sp. Se-20373]|uniref:methyltransferase domain-containing protein n=1 Tax=Burkholderia sp. Se-20373 TaxID=2703898 RepID=UPI00198122DB|nr:methyltransferase domain-containing protein [Burkholderia sp. Se-20373]MBN3749154.1 methyltransferase domain-containing protein [Burkholderia sp. Se-20373]